MSSVQQRQIASISLAIGRAEHDEPERPADGDGSSRNLPYDADENLIDSRSRPLGAGFPVAKRVSGAANDSAQLRFAFHKSFQDSLIRFFGFMFFASGSRYLVFA